MKVFDVVFDVVFSVFYYYIFSVISSRKASIRAYPFYFYITIIYHPQAYLELEELIHFFINIRKEILYIRWS